MIGNEKTPDLDLGYAGFGADYPDPNAFFEPLLAGASILPTNNTNLARIDDPELNKKIATAGDRTDRPQAGKGIRRARQGLHGTGAVRPLRQPDLASVFVSSDIDFEDVIWNPIFSGDLTSFQFK